MKINVDESFETALRKFKRKCRVAGIFAEIKKRRYYEKPSVKRRKKIDAAKRDAMKMKS